MKAPETIGAGAVRTFFAKLWSNQTIAHSLQINALRAFSLGIGFLGSIWSSRCLGPDKLGISGMIIGTITPLVLVINLNQTAHYIRLYRGHALENERNDLISIISTYKIVASCTVMVIAIPLLLFGHFSSAWHLGLVAAFPYFFLTANAADWLLQSEDNVPATSRALTIQALVTTSLYFLIFRPGISAGADLVTQTVGLSIASAYAWFTALNRRKIRLFDWKKLRLIFPIIAEGRWLIATGTAVYIFTALEVPLLGWLYSLKELGIYRTAVVLVGGITAFTAYWPILLYPRMIEWNQKGVVYLWERQKRVLTYFALFAVCLSGGAFLFAPLGYHFLYGPAFQRGAYPFAILLTAKLVSLPNGILSWGMLAQKRDRALFKIMVYVSAFSLASNLIFIPKFGAFGASTTSLLSELFMFSRVMASIRRSLKNA
jgi:O-antigen/teichoic acid export membrane protein